MSLVTFITLHVLLPSETCSVHWQQIPAVRTAADAAEQISNQGPSPFLSGNSCSVSPVPGHPHLPCTPDTLVHRETLPRAEQSRGTKAWFGLIQLETGIIQLSPPGLNLKNSVFCFFQTWEPCEKRAQGDSTGKSSNNEFRPTSFALGWSNLQSWGLNSHWQPAENSHSKYSIFLSK